MKKVLILCVFVSLWLASCRKTSQFPFRDVAAETGLDFRHQSGASGQWYMTEIMGSGGALFDYDNDGDLDVYLVQASGGSNRLFRNELVPSGKLRFVDVTAQSGAGHAGNGMGAATGDYDNDGDLDLYLTCFGPNVLYRNNGNGTFTDVTKETNADDPRWSTGAAFFDYDRDGDLDLYIVNYIDFTIQGNKRCYAPTGEPDYCTPKMYQPVTDRLFRNDLSRDGKRKFADVTGMAGLGAAAGPGLGVVVSDFTGDGWPDVYVANDGAPNFLWRNIIGSRGSHGRFEEIALISGAAYGADGVAKAGMGVTAGDYDNDGDEDIFVVNLRREGATLYQNTGKGFNDATLESGLAQPSFPFTGFGTEFFDYDNDGHLDLFVANGAVTVLESQKASPYPFAERNQLYHNEGAGKGFREVSSAAGPALALEEVSRGAAFGDIDNDGDVDILVTNNNGPVRLLLNEAAGGRTWLSLRLESKDGNRDAIGARVSARRTGEKPLWRRVHTDSSYLSASDIRVHFGLDSARMVTVAVRWPDGSSEQWPGVLANRFHVLRQGTGQAQ